MFIGNAASVGCKEATIEPLAALTTPESKYYADHFIETVVEERNGQLTRFAEAYKTLKPGLQFYETQAKRAADQHYQLKKQYETGLEEHRKKLSVTFKELSARYEATAKQEIAKAVKSVKANEQSAEEIWVLVQTPGSRGADPCVLQLNFTSNYAAKAACQISGIVALRPPSFPI